MSLAARSSTTLLAILLAIVGFGCEEHKEEPAAPKASATAPVVPAATASAKPKAKPKPREDCPEGSSGIGTFDEPCKGSGATRMMEIEYSGKTTEKGPKFKVTNKSGKPILHGSVAVYFYDKAGKLLEVPGKKKDRTKQICSGNIFAGHVKPDEEIWVFFSCVNKSHVPEGTETIEAEAYTVGFYNEEEKTNEFFWQNEDLVPADRPKGGIKEDTKKKK